MISTKSSKKTKPVLFSPLPIQESFSSSVSSAPPVSSWNSVQLLLASFLGSPIQF